MSWLISAAGAVLVAVVLRDVFHTIWHPSGHGALTRLVMRSTWRAGRSLGERTRMLTGPLGMLLVVATWATLTVVGWALVFGPHLPGSFSYSAGLLPGQRSMVLDAVYLSLVTVATLGFGDITPIEGWLRVVTPLAALMGIVLVTAAVTWVLQLYPALARRRVLAVRLRLLAAAQHGVPEAARAAQVPPSTVHDLAATVSAVRIDVTQYPESHWFFDRHDTSLAVELPGLLTLAEAGENSDQAELRVAAAVLRGALVDLADTLDRQFFRVRRDTAGVLQVYAQQAGGRARPSVR